MPTEHVRNVFYRKSSFGLSTWTIWYEGDKIYYASALSEGGSPQVHVEQVLLNQSGRSLAQQIELQMRSRLSRMLDKGYKKNRDEALAGATNQLGFLNPMLAHPIEKVATPYISEERPAHVQIKYDGHRCLITKWQGNILAYTRKGKPITTIGHILRVLQDRLAEGVTLDGELYVHGKSLQNISSLIKRDQPGSAALSYHVYDIVEDLPFSERWELAKHIVEPVQSGQLFCVPTEKITSLAGAYAHFKVARGNGYEGSMLRLDGSGYEDGKRSGQLLKLKTRLDEDFEVVDVFAGKYDVGILKLKLNDRPGTFDCTAPGSVPEKQAILKDKHLYIGKMVEVEYAYKTNDGIPFHAVAIRFKEEL